jgi:hypothetical protein
MNKIKKLYKEFFGLQEQAAVAKQNPNDIEIAASVAKDPTALKAAQDAAKKAGGNIRITANESDLDEAQLINHMTDYRGGIEYVIRDAAQARNVMSDILQWSQKKGFTVIKKKISKTGTIGYIYFRLGEDPARESQKIQGYISQKPEIKHFRFKVRGEETAVATPAPIAPVAAPIAPQAPQPNI